MVLCYVELNSEEIIREGDCRISCTSDLVPMPESWIGKTVAELAPIKVGRPRATLIAEALHRVREELIAEYGIARYRVNFSYVDEALGK